MAITTHATGAGYCERGNLPRAIIPGGSEMMRVTLYLSEKERIALQQEADRLHTSVNFIVRSLVRIHLGMDTPPESSPVDKLFTQQT